MALRFALIRSGLVFQSFRRQNVISGIYQRTYMPTYSTQAVPDQLEAVEKLLKTPTWSVSSLLPPDTPQPDAPKISSTQLHHLLRLSALPLPESREEEAKMLETLSAQLHFVGEIQQVDTSGVVPLRAIRDETIANEEAQAVTLDSLKDALAQEEVIGKHYRRVKRKTDRIDAKEVEDWDVLGNAERKVGKYFVVESERP